MIIKVDSWIVLRQDAALIRHAVFCIEQSIPEEQEWDEMDEASQHAVAYGASGQPIGTGRLLPNACIGRMAVLKSHRKMGVGGTILESLIKTRRHLLQLNNSPKLDTCVRLHAQVRVEGFYRHHGFETSGPIFMEAGIPHVLMCRNLA